MVLLVEQERLASVEQEVLTDDTTGVGWEFPVAYGDTAGNHYITTTNNKLIVYSFEVANTDTVSRNFQLAMKMDGNILFSSGDYTPLAAGVSVVYSGILFLPADTYTVTFDGIASVADLVRLKNINFGLVAFNDQTMSAEIPYVDGVTADVSTTRLTPIGNIAYNTIILQVAASTAGETTIMDMASTDNTNGVRLLVNGVRADWTTRYNNTAVTYHSASGTYVEQVAAGATRVFTIVKEDANTVVNVSLVCCPWILPPAGSTPSTTLFPVSTLSFPQGSTLYVNLEPLFVDVTKYFFIGKHKAISFGNESDYYYYPYGTGILNCAYSFELPEVTSVGCYAYGWGGCINQIGVDNR